MTHDPQVLLAYVKGCLIVAAICTTIFPVFYLLFLLKRKQTLVGIALLIQGLVFALIVDLTLLFMYWSPHNILVMLWVNSLGFTLISIATAFVTGVFAYVNFFQNGSRKLKSTEDKTK